MTRAAVGMLLNFHAKTGGTGRISRRTAGSSGSLALLFQLTPLLSNLGRLDGSRLVALFGSSTMGRSRGLPRMQGIGSRLFGMHRLRTKRTIATELGNHVLDTARVSR